MFPLGCALTPPVSAMWVWGVSGPRSTAPPTQPPFVCIAFWVWGASGPRSTAPPTQPPFIWCPDGRASALPLHSVKQVIWQKLQQITPNLVTKLLLLFFSLKCPGVGERGDGTGFDEPQFETCTLGSTNHRPTNWVRRTAARNLYPGFDEPQANKLGSTNRSPKPVPWVRRTTAQHWLRRSAVHVYIYIYIHIDHAAII